MPSGPGTYGTQKGRPPMKNKNKKKKVTAMGGGYMSMGNKKKKSDTMKAGHGGMAHKKNKK